MTLHGEPYAIEDNTETTGARRGDPPAEVMPNAESGDARVLALPNRHEGVARVWDAFIEHSGWISIAAVLGLLLAFFWLFRVSLSPNNPLISQRSADKYSTTLSVVVDTTEFGIGRSDTNMNNLSDLAPTYAQLLTSDVIRRSAEASLGAKIDPKSVSDTVEQGSPMIKLSVEGTEAATLPLRAQALLNSLRDYIATGQQQNGVPQEFRLTVRGIGAPSKPEIKSNRQLEIALILLVFPVMAALALAVRLESRKELDTKKR
jgi:hypothetical protein